MVQSLAWNSDCNMLAAIHDSRFSVFLYPTVIYVDRGLLGNQKIQLGVHHRCTLSANVFFIVIIIKFVKLYQTFSIRQDNHRKRRK